MSKSDTVGGSSKSLQIMQAGCYDRIVLITIFDDNRPRVNKISSAGMPVFTKLGHPLLFMFNMTEFIPNIDVLFFLSSE